jgi:hypothetical protein
VNAWTEREDALICELRADKVPIAQIAPKFPHRTREAVDARIRHLIRRGRIQRLRGEGLGHNPWTSRDEALLMRLRACDPPATLDEIVERMPHRTRTAIANRISELIDAGAIDRGPRSPQSRRPWSAVEDQLIADMRRTNKTTEEIALELDRTVASINGRIAYRMRKGEQLPKATRS